VVWAKNLLFVAVVLGGVGALGANLIPARKPRSLPAPDPTAAAEVAPVVTRLNDALRQQWERQQVQPAPAAPDEVLVRRLSLALTGTIPSLEEVRQWESLPPGRLVDGWLDHLFRDRRYADYLAERLARAYVGSEEGPFVFYRRRRFVAWLSDQVLANRRYDETVRELLTSTGLWTDKPATNFLTVTFEPDNDKNQPNPERLAGRVARALLGVRLDCAQCHNHPFQPWKQADFQGLAAFFGQAKNGFTGIGDDPTAEWTVENRKTLAKEPVAPHVPFLAEALPADGTRREQLAAWITDPRNRYFARATANRVWALLFGRPLVEPVDDLPSAGDPPPALEILADDFIANGYDLQRLVRTIAATAAFRLDSATDATADETHEKAWAVFPLTRLRPEQVIGSLLQAAQVHTLDSESHIAVRFFRAIGENDFVKRYGDTGEDEFEGRGGTIPQRLLMMNGKIVYERTKDGLFNAATRIAMMARDDERAIETAYLAVLTRRPTTEEMAHFKQRLDGAKGNERNRRIEDLYWALVNSTEFSWNH
jgi:hypothetical protein